MFKVSDGIWIFDVWCWLIDIQPMLCTNLIPELLNHNLMNSVKEAESHTRSSSEFDYWFNRKL